MINCTFENGSKASLRHAVVDVLVVEDNQILLVKRNPKLLEGGKWGLVGGFVGRDETLEEAAKREALEETGYKVGITKLLRIKDDPNRPKEDRQNISFVYVARPVKEVSSPDKESTAIKWFNLKNLPPEEDFAFDHYQDISLYLKDY